MRTQIIKSGSIAIMTVLYCSVVNAQLISKKESKAIDNLLTEWSLQFKPQTYLIKNVDILTMNSSELIRNKSVLIENGVIQEIGTEIQNKSALVIDGKGKVLMPGLTDMHVHLFDKHPLKNTWMMLLLLNGVTSVRDMCGEPPKLQLREKINRNEMLAPTLYQAGPIINGVKDNSGLFAFASTPEQGREIVRSQKQSGYDFIKVYNGLENEVFTAIVDEANKQQMPVGGHLPDNISLEQALKLNNNSIEHLSGYFEWKNNQIFLKAPDNYASLTANADVWNCPTIYNHYLNGSRKGVTQVINYANESGLIPDDLKGIWEKRLSNNSKEVIEIVDKYGESNFEVLKQIVLQLYHSKAKLIAGTDSGNLPFLIPGYSLHQELKIMNELGIPVYEVLKMATSNASIAINKTSEFGTVEVGKRADLLLLNTNPLDNINNLQDRNGMMIRGIWLSEENMKVMTSKIKSIFAE